MNKRGKKTPTKPKHREALQGKGFKTVIVNPDPRLQSDYVPGPEPDLLSKGFGSLSGPKPGGILFVVTFQLRWANREQLPSFGCHLHLTWALRCFLVHLQTPGVTTPSPRVTAAGLKQSNLPVCYVQFIGKS